MKGLYLAAVAAVAFFCASCVRAVDRDGVDTSICDLANNAAAMHGRHIRFKAVYISDSIHTTALKDPTCPGEAIVPFDPIDPDPSVLAFDDATAGGILDPELQTFVVDVSGVYQLPAKGERYGRLILDTVFGFQRFHGDWRNAFLQKAPPTP